MHIILRSYENERINIFKKCTKHSFVQIIFFLSEYL